ncbi:MAG: PQQ-binding-like beta-propeller repeat protein [Methanoregula sp.]
MQRVNRTIILVVALCLFCGITATVYGETLTPFWTVHPPDDLPVRGITLADDGSRILVGGSQLTIFSRGGDRLWSGDAGAISAMSGDGNYVITAIDRNLRLLDKSGAEVWTRTMNTPVNYVAISKIGPLVVAMDTDGDISSWDLNGWSNGTLKIEPVKNLAISPNADLIVVTTVSGLRYVNPDLTLRWTDRRTDSLDTYIAISADGSIIYTAGSKRVSSHTKDGTLNWQKIVTDDDITSLACSGDGQTVVVGSQDANVYALDSQGNTHTKYKTGQWINAVAVSQDGTIIATVSVDRSLSLLTRNGQLQATIKTGAIVQPRSLAISSDKTYLVAADPSTIYAYYIETGAISPDETAPPRIISSRTTTMTPAALEITTTVVTPSITVTEEIPTAIPTTKKSPVSVVTGVCAIAVVLMLARRTI